MTGFINGSTPPTTETPSRAIFASTGPDGNQHLYALDLTIADSGPSGPTPQQITNLSVPSSQAICQAGQLQSTLTDPTTLAVVVYVVTPAAGSQPGTTGYCGPGGGTYELAHYTDTASTSPVTLTLPGGTSMYSALQNDGPFSTLYMSNGTLGGVTLWDASDETLLFYTGESFSSGVTVLSNVSAPIGIFSRTVLYGADFVPGLSELFDTTSAGSSQANHLSLQSGDSPYDSIFFVGTVASAVADDNNLYFIGTPNGSSTAAIYKEPLSFSSVAPVLSTAPQSISGAEQSILVWSNDSALIFENIFENSGAASYTLSSVPTDSSSSTATTIAGPISGDLTTAFMAAPNAGPASGNLLFLTTSSGSTSSPSYSSSVLSATGAVQLTQSNTVLGSFNTLSTELSGSVWEVEGITDTNGAYGGGTIKQLDVATLSTTSLTTTGGSAYVVPSGDFVSLVGFTGTTTAVGSAIPFSSATAGSVGLIMDEASHLIATIEFNNSNVVPLTP
jgi:hypothetical protein